MNRKKWLANSLCLILALTTAAIPSTAIANSTRVTIDASPALNNTATPIGAVEAIGAISINGRAANGKDVVWDGEWLQAPAGASAVVKLDAVGEVTLAGSTMVRLGVASGALEAQKNKVMVASVLTGEVNVKLNPSTSAYLEVGGETYLAESGSDFRLGVRDGAIDVKSTGGRVQPLGNWALAMPTLKEGPNGKAPSPVASIIGSKSDSSRTMTEMQRESLRASVKQVLHRGSLMRVNPIKLYTTSTVRMIGVVEAVGKMKINGRDVRGQEMLWDGEMIQAPADSPARISLPDIGHVTLASGAVVKLSTVATKPDAISERRALAATVISGEMSVKLLPDAQAFVEADAQAFVASDGAQFRVRAGAAEKLLSTANGSVRTLGGWSIVPASDLLKATVDAQPKAQTRQYVIQG